MTLKELIDFSTTCRNIAETFGNKIYRASLKYKIYSQRVTAQQITDYLEIYAPTEIPIKLLLCVHSQLYYTYCIKNNVGIRGESDLYKISGSVESQIVSDYLTRKAIQLDREDLLKELSAYNQLARAYLNTDKTTLRKLNVLSSQEVEDIIKIRYSCLPDRNMVVTERILREVFRNDETFVRLFTLSFGNRLGDYIELYRQHKYLKLYVEIIGVRSSYTYAIRENERRSLRKLIKWVPMRDQTMINTICQAAIDDRSIDCIKVLRRSSPFKENSIWAIYDKNYSQQGLQDQLTDQFRNSKKLGRRVTKALAKLDQEAIHLRAIRWCDTKLLKYITSKPDLNPRIIQMHGSKVQLFCYMCFGIESKATFGGDYYSEKYLAMKSLV